MIQKSKPFKGNSESRKSTTLPISKSDGLEKTLQSWKTKVNNCTNCEIASFCKHKVLPTIEPKSDILLVGEAPGASEYARQRPFAGPAGDELQRILDDAIPKRKVSIANTVFCTPFEDDSLYSIRPPSLSEVKACRGHLQSLINILKPRYIFALGKIAGRALKSLSVEHKEIMHPSAIMQDKNYSYLHNRAVVAMEDYIEKG